MNWEERSCKNKIRERVLSCLEEVEKPFSYLGLPASLAIFENMMFDKFWDSGFKKITLFEKDPLIYQELLSNVKNLDLATSDLNLLHDDLDAWVLQNSGNLNHDVVWLDYCGPVTPSRLKTIELFSKKMNNKSLLILTLMCGREKTPCNKAIRDYYSKEIVSPYVVRCRLILDLLLKANPGKQYELVALPYLDTAPMFLLTIKEIKKRRSYIKVLERLRR